MRRTTLLLALLTGCAAPPASPPAVRAPSLGEQLREQDRALIGQRFRTVLDFELPADDTFVDAAVRTAAAGHTGRRAIGVGPEAIVRVSSLQFGLKLPGEFTLLGGYVRPTGGAVTATLLADGEVVARTVRDVPAGNWAFVAVELTSDLSRRTLPTAKDVRLTFSSDGGFELDDVMFVDNRITLAEAAGGWSVVRDGMSIVVATPFTPMRQIPSVAAAADGWTVAEVNALRLRLTDATGQRHWTLLPDGRSVVDGRLDSGDVDAINAFRNPAELTIDDGTGRLDRETPGDANNDGFNETRAAYQIVANAGRLHFRVTPRGQAMTSPSFEIRGLPAEARVVTADGKLIDKVARLPDGTLLVTLPMRVDSPVEVTIGVGG